MEGGNQNPLLGPLEQDAGETVTQLPSPSRGGWSASELLQAIIGVATLGFVVVQSIPAVRAAFPGPTQTGALGAAILVVAGVLLVTFGVRRIVRVRLQNRRERESAATPPDRVTELAIFIQKSRRIWSSGSNYVGSFEQAAQRIINDLNGPGGSPPDIPAESRRAADHANVLFNGWRATSATQDAVFWEMERLIDDLRTTDRDRFVTSLLLLRQVLLGSLQVANMFADEVRRCDPGAVPDWSRATWSEFRDYANRLSADVTMLGERTKRDFGRRDLTFYLPSVRSVSTP